MVEKQTSESYIQKALHWGDVEKLDGKSVVSLWGENWREIQELEGYVIDAKIPKNLINIMGGLVYPCKRSSENRDQTKKLEEAISEKLKTNQIMAVVIKSREGDCWKAGFLSTQDLLRDPKDLIDEEAEARSDGNDVLANSKVLAYEAITGEELTVE